jgi:hypothetical protein
MKKMMPMYESLEKEFLSTKEVNKMNFFVVDATREENEPLTEAMDVRAYPSIHIFEHQHFVRAYLGKQKKTKLREFLLGGAKMMEKKEMTEKKETDSEGTKKSKGFAKAEVTKAEVPKREEMKRKEEEGRKEREREALNVVKEEEKEKKKEEEKEEETEKEKLPPGLSFNSLVLQQIVRRDITIPHSKTCQVHFLYSSNHPLERELTSMFKVRHFSSFFV